MSLRISLFSVLLLLPFLNWAQEQLSLSDAILKGLNNNYNIKIADRDFVIARNNNDWAIAGKYPSIDLGLTWNNGYTNNNNPASFLTEFSSFSTGPTPSAEASLTLFDGYRIRFTKRQLEELENLSNGNLEVTVENAAQSIILAYYEVLIQKEQRKVLEDVLTLSRDRIQYQEVRKEFGQAGTFDLIQAQDAYFNDSTSYLIQLNTETTAMRNLNLAVGEDNLNYQYELTDKLAFEPQVYDLEAIKEKMLANNKELKNLFINQELANINTKIQESAKYPVISARAGLNYNYNLSSGSGTLSNGESLTLDAVVQKTFNGFINLSATYNIFDGGVRKKRISNARTEELIALLNIESLKRNLNAQVTNTFETYNNQRALVLLTNELLDNAQKNLDIAEERFKGGLINSFDYRSIQMSYINASQSRLNAIFNLKNTETELIRLMGDLARK